MSRASLAKVAPFTAGLSAGDLLKHLAAEVAKVESAVNEADSLTAVAARALRQQGCDLDYAVADVLENHAFQEIENARAALGTVEAIIQRLQQLSPEGARP